MIEAVKTNPALPVWWGKNQSGMQANEELDNIDKVYGQTVSPIGTVSSSTHTAKDEAQRLWLEARDKAIVSAELMEKLGLHKQIAGRILEPWGHITVIASATEYENFFSLRAHKDAQPEFQKLAYEMLGLYNAHTPTLLSAGEWHIPFGDRMPEGIRHDQKLKIATARCARTSYLTFDGDIDPQKDYQLHDQLASSGHWSPFEHCAKADWADNHSGNFKGWIQYRKQFFGENRKDERVTKF
jgi:hypothetical protein